MGKPFHSCDLQPEAVIAAGQPERRLIRAAASGNKLVGTRTSSAFEAARHPPDRLE